MSYRKKTVIILVVCSIIFNGCLKKNDNIRVKFAKRQCLVIIQSPDFPIEAKKRAREALNDWENGYLDSQPILIDAKYQESQNGGYLLTLYMSDEDFDVQGFIIRETHLYPDGSVETLEEDYPIFVGYAAGVTERIRFFKREEYAIRKSEEEWNIYLKKGSYGGERNYPIVFCSIPCPPEINVEILIYDESGNKSVFCPLHNQEETEKVLSPVSE